MTIVGLSVALGDGPFPGARGFTVTCLPVEIAGASAGWCRAVAVVDGP